MPAQQGIWLEDDRRVEQRREQPIKADEDQTVCRLQPGAGWCRAFQDDDLLPEIDDLGFTLRRRATQPSDQGREKSQEMDHPAGSLAGSQALESLDKIFGRDTHANNLSGSGRTRKRPISEKGLGLCSDCPLAFQARYPLSSRFCPKLLASQI
jgi:hypothetical protein